MRGFTISILMVFLLASCAKEDFGQYDTVQEPINNNISDTTSYVYGGTVPNGNNASNDLIGTKWVLTKYVSAFATESPNDTIEFVSANRYTINGGAVRTYQLSSSPNSTNYQLSLYFFFPFGGSHYTSQVGHYFIEDGEVNNVDFIDNQNINTTIKAWFVRI
jgi:hypothetical protein